MRGLLEPLAAGLDLRLSAEVHALRGGPGAWRLELVDGRDIGPFGSVGLAIPAPQAERLLERSGVARPAAFASVAMGPRWALLLGFDDPPGQEPAVAAGAVLATVTRHTPAAPAGDRGAFAETWVVHATRDWSSAHLELSREEAAERLLRALAGVVAIEPAYAVAHRWRFALTERPLGQSHVWLADARIGLCGDWCLGDRAEHAYQSGIALAKALGRSLKV
jgi:predicted NAD/FAD-dependent oxidoreductase